MAGLSLTKQELQELLVAKAKADMRERCARMAIDWRGWTSGNRVPTPEEIAAAIRALPDD